jgi:FkbM family methyltransferase
LSDQYFPADLFQLGHNEVFVDCGAYDGDTLKAFLERTHSEFKEVVAIEPDRANVKKLEAFVASLGPDLQPKIQIKPFGVGAENQIATFAASGSESSAMSEHGDTTIEVKRLDDLLAAKTPTYIKMDIEGAELPALAGAAQTIARHHPKMAVCIYHAQEHLWEIPLRLNGLYPSCRLFIRRYRDEFGDVVCYAIP